MQGARHNETENESYAECIKACLERLQRCNSFDICLIRREHNGRICILLDRQCADMCNTAVQAMTRNSPYAEDICLLCAKGWQRVQSALDNH